MKTKIKNNKIGYVGDTPSEIKNQAIKWLERIGVVKSDIDFDYIRSENWAEVIFNSNQKEYIFKSTKQKDYKTNLKAIEIFIHNRVINIERGIEEIETAFKGYLQLENKKNLIENPYFNLSEKEIKSMMKIHHPDLNGDREKFELLQTALKFQRNNKK